MTTSSNAELKINSENTPVNEIQPEAPALVSAEIIQHPALAKPTVQGNLFHALNLPASLKTSLDKMSFTKPTPIQAKAIPMALSGKDILGSAQTGTGKTGAFAIPTIAKLIADPTATAIILTPTRELATQVFTTIKPMLGNDIRGIRTALLIGGEFIGKQLSQLRNNPRLIIGTPGRVNDHLQRKSLDLSKVAVFILDETDRMLDLGFGIQIEHIARSIPTERQTLLFSATMPHNIMSLSKRYLKNPEVISIEPEKVTTENVKQTFVKVNDFDKFDMLKEELNNRTGSVIIFVKTKMGSEKLAKKLDQAGEAVDVLHGDLRQSRRDRVIKNYRAQAFRILIATDVAARGLDIPHIEHVINYDLPQCPEDYVHRIGRTGRNGATGEALSFVGGEDARKYRDIERMLNPNAPREKREHDGGRSEGRRDGGRRGGFGGGQRRSNGDGPFGGFKRRDDSRGSFGGERREGGRDGGRSENRGGFGGERRDFNDRPRRDENRSFSDRPKRDENRSFGDRPRRDDSRGFGGGERSFSERPRSEGRFDRGSNFEGQGNKKHFDNRDDNFGNRESASHQQYDGLVEDRGNRNDRPSDNRSKPRGSNGFGFSGKRTGGGFGGDRNRSGKPGGFRKGPGAGSRSGGGFKGNRSNNENRGNN